MVASSSPRESSLPLPLTTLIGREREIASASDLLLRPGVRLVTLTGPGGVGKTRVAHAVAEDSAGTFPDGVVLVSLAPIRNPHLVPSAIAQALDVRGIGEQSAVERIIAVVGSRRILLVLDNFEQVLDAAGYVSRLLSGCPNLSVLVTSRAVVHLSGEHTLAIPPLERADPHNLPSLAALQAIEAVRLFVERAQAARADISLTEANASSVAAICTSLDGLPLAIELAAARVRVLSPQALLAQLERRLRLLTGGPRDAPARQQTMRATIAWSYDLLHPDEQRLLRQLSVFAGGWTLEAAEVTCDPDLDVLDGMTALIDHSLVLEGPGGDGGSRYSMLETIREFAREQLDVHGETDIVRARHATHYLALADVPDAAGLYGFDQGQWLRRLDAERDNLRAALAWALETGNPADALRLAAWLGRYWSSRGLEQEAAGLLEAALAVGTDAPDTIRAAGLLALGRIEIEWGRFEPGGTRVEEALALFEVAGDAAGLADTLVHLGDLEMYQGRYAEADALYLRSLVHARAAGDLAREGVALGCSALMQTVDGDFSGAKVICAQALVPLRQSGDLRAIGNISAFLGIMELWDGNAARAADIAEECIAIAREVGDNMIVALTLQLLGLAQVELDQPERAWASLIEALTLDRMLDAWEQITEDLGGMAVVIHAWGEPACAARVMGAVTALREQMGVPIHPPRRPRYERTVAAIRAELTSAQFDAQWAAGAALSFEEAIACALESRPPSPGEPAHLAANLSPRELEVVRLLVHGHTNQEIAATLSISRYTVANHVRNIMNKLGLDSRTAVAAWAVRAGID